ncbi:hypothetical protein FOZ63_001320 [Perkinsus olseni]|uniref:Mitochondrial import receptor subunit TOM40B n=1 Tax=Perkinsus olseni TaxID=32597 RepID=A0A7J6PBI7_PEROL|nr:hypothetical protein FOZ62_029510 [Perkinsus olseni]KAF4741394.1 hypothetical protein FOZ63_001320 [Perkinsus olseni]
MYIPTHPRILFGWSVALLALLPLAEALVSSLENFPGRLPSVNIHDWVVTPELINFFKALEAYFVKMDEQRVATFSAGPQLASVSADGTFAFPPNCTPLEKPANYPYCFHGNRTHNGNNKNITAIVDFFDVNDPKDNTVIGFAAEYEGATARGLEAYAGGEAELMIVGNKSYAGAAVYLKTYEVELPQPGMLGALQNSFVAEPHIKFYAFNYEILDVEGGPVPTSNVYAKKSVNVGFNVSAGIERPVQFGSVGASLHLTLNTVKGNDSRWLLNGVGKATFKLAGILNLNLPINYLKQEIVIP